MDAICACSERRPPQLDVVVLADGEHGTSGRMGCGDRRETVVRPGRQVDHHAFDVGERPFERRERPHRSRLGTRATHEVGEARRPDQVIRKDGDARGQARPPAR